MTKDVFFINIKYRQVTLVLEKLKNLS